jgi:putative membrane protein
VHWVGFCLTLALSSLTFLFIVIGLVRAFGDAGKALSMVLLTLQTSASGGLMPVELSGSLYESISPWLPMTWVVKGIKASMFGAFNHAWGQPQVLIAVCGLSALLVSAYIGRWRYLEASSIHRPAINF